MNSVDRLICGVATVFDQPSPNEGRSWSADLFREWLELETAIPLQLDHGPIINSWGVTDRLGYARRFAVVSYPVNGLLCLAEIEHADGWGDGLLHDIQSVLSQRWLPAAWGMSIGAWVTEDAVVPYEVSLTRKPAYGDAMVLGVGADALQTWDLLTEATPTQHLSEAVDG